jgi:hypothetical protein
MRSPDPFLEVRVHDLSSLIGLTGLCAGYELNEWRARQLAAHLIEWLPEFALTHSEIESIEAHNAVALIARAAQTVYTSEKYQKRGEIGELLLHIAIRQVFDTLPAISKYYYKDSSNDTVKGFDAVHVVVTDESLQLWLGEAKFYTDIDSAIKDAVEDIAKHIERDYLRSEFNAITNKIDSAWPHSDKLEKLLHRNTPLDEVFDSLCIPVFLSYESVTVLSHNSVTEAFKAAFVREVIQHHSTFCSKSLPAELIIHLFLFPMKSKQELLKYFDEKLKACQTTLS